MLTVDRPVGIAYLDAVTTLLQRRGLADPGHEVWEAADMQWWWPRHPHEDPADARVWSDGGESVAAVVFTPWSADRVGCDVLGDADFHPAWAFAAEACARRKVPRIEMAVWDEDPAARNAARRAGFVPSEEAYSVGWMDPEARVAPRRALPDGYRIVARADDADRPHHMTTRNGADLEARLRQCSLYDAGLDLLVVAPDDSVAGYALFWPDPVTGVGMVEPMRVEAAHAGQGIAAQLLDAGLRGLAARGCTRLKVSMEPGNTPAVRLYTGAGFVVSRRDTTWVYRT